MSNPNLFMSNPGPKLWRGPGIIYLSGICLLAACQPAETLTLDVGDLEDYIEFLEDQDPEDIPDPFKAEPLTVSATGKVRAQPDVAVITATISAENKNESQAVDDMSGIINTLQTALSEQTVETGFTAISSNREYDEACRNENFLAMRQHSQITNDYWFNRRLDQRGDTETKRRKPVPRKAQRVCSAQSIKVSTRMTVRVQPADAAGSVLTALSEAGAKEARLYGYDYSNYDALYQEAAQISVKLARKKAEAIARISGTSLGDIENFVVTSPGRTGRFGPQPNIIRPAPPPSPQNGSAVDRSLRNQSMSMRARSYAPPAANMTCWDGSVVAGNGSCPGRPAMPQSDFDIVTETVVVQEASTELVSIPPSYETVNGRQVIRTPASTVERVIPAVTKMETRRVNSAGQSALESNALSMSLLSGPQTIKVTTTLSYNYKTPLDRKIIMTAKD